ncbi:MAG TPA: hypothetical protein P5013_04550 [Methanoregula sp.]|nr:hypothetical protein [Methanoregula sp.]
MDVNIWGQKKNYHRKGSFAELKFSFRFSRLYIVLWTNVVEEV